jgi:hypothetical protein
MRNREDFREQLGAAFDVSFDGEVILQVELKEVADLASNAKESFSAVFVGPKEKQLAQGLYHLSTADNVADVFLVPIGPFAGGMGYEAVYN